MNNLKKAVEVKEQMDKKKKEYLDNLDFEALYNKIAEKLNDIQLYTSYLKIKNESILKILGFEEEEYKSQFYNHPLIDDILQEITTTLTNLGYVVEPYYQFFNNINTKSLGIKIYWDPKDVPSDK